MYKWLFISIIFFLVCCATTCDESVEVYVNVYDLTLVHLDNSGENFIECKQGKAIPKEAYLLKVIMLDTMGRPITITDSYHDYVLEDPVRQLRIIDRYLGEEGNAVESDVTSSFKGLRYTINENSYNVTGGLLTPVYDASDLYLALRGNILSGKHQFVVEFLLESGKSLIRTTTPIVLY